MRGMSKRRAIGALLAGLMTAGLVMAGPAEAAAPKRKPKPTVEGFLRLTAKTGRQGQTKVSYAVQALSGTYRLKLPVVPNVTPRQRRALRNALQAAADQRVLLTGHWAQAPSTFVVNRVDVLPPLPNDPPEPPPLPVRPRRVALVVVKWTGAGGAGVPDLNTYRSWTFNGPSSLAGYYSAVSNNVIRITGEAMTVSMPNNFGKYLNNAGNCTPLDAAFTFADAHMPQLDAYDTILFVPQYTGPDCTEVGMAHLKGRYALVNSRNANNAGRFTYIAAHEVGHNFGLMHAGFARCAAPVVEACMTSGLYADPWDPMGSATDRPPQFSAVHKRQLGILAPSAVVTATHSGIYWLRASDAPGAGGVRLIQIPFGTDGRMYGLEVRGPSAPFAPYAPDSNVATGVSIRLFAADGSTVFDDHNDATEDLVPDSSILVDATPANGFDAYKSALPANATWSDPSVGIGVRTLQAGWGWALVQITRP